MKNEEVIPIEQIYKGLDDFYNLGFRMAINFLTAGEAEVIVAKSSAKYGEFVQAQQVTTQMLAENLYAVLFVVANKSMDIYNEQAKEFDKKKKQHELIHGEGSTKLSFGGNQLSGVMMNYNNPTV